MKSTVKGAVHPKKKAQTDTEDNAGATTEPDSDDDEAELGKGSVRQYQDLKDCTATSNLKSHAIKCFGEAVVEAAFGQEISGLSRDGSIFAAFARRGQQPITVSHHALTSDENCAHITLWCAESNRPMNIVKDQHFNTLMKAGQPSTSISSPTTISRDIKAAFQACCQRIDSILWPAQPESQPG
ncbi:hypothetical protein H0H92_005103 [Tricholoma furcatifolium]|nr:hypothetical protein H0H92_005103 [Tricholoma furcatifolium]